MEINVSVLLVLLCAHFVADFIGQTDAMAKGKSKSNKILMQHIQAYTGITFLFTVFMFGLIGAAMYAVINGILHYQVDYITSRATSKLWAEQRVHEFFVIIGLDQLIHTICIIISSLVFWNQNGPIF